GVAGSARNARHRGTGRVLPCFHPRLVRRLADRDPAPMTPNIKPQIVAPTPSGPTELRAPTRPDARPEARAPLRPQMIDALGRRGRWTRGRLLTLALVLAAAAGTAATVIVVRSGPSSRDYQTDAVTRTDLVMRVSAPGSLDVDNAVPVPAPL